MFIWNTSTCPPLFCTKAKFSEVHAQLHAQAASAAAGRQEGWQSALALQQEARPAAARPEQVAAGQPAAVADRPSPEPLTLLLLREGNSRPGAPGGQLCGPHGPRTLPESLNQAWVGNQQAAADCPQARQRPPARGTPCEMRSFLLQGSGQQSNYSQRKATTHSDARAPIACLTLSKQ